MTKREQKKKTASKVVDGAGDSKTAGFASFLRAINIKMDAASADRIAHFHPTSKAIRLIRALLDGDEANAWLISAPYGTGKSLAATYTLQLIENCPDSKPVLRSLNKRIEILNPELAKANSRRLRGKARGVVLALHGYAPNLAEAIQEAVAESLQRMGLTRKAGGIRRRKCQTIEDAVDLLSNLEQRAAELGIDRVVLIWDEFGRHIEALVSKGRPAQLLDVQLLAEYAARTSEPAFRLGLILHQGVASYAGSLPENTRREWAKIEGRFERLDYVDDSKEILQLAAELADMIPSAGKAPRPSSKKSFIDAAKRARKLGLFAEFTQKEATDLLAKAWPLSAATLYLLPRVAGRIAQNERTLYSFIQSAHVGNEILPDSLYQFFEPVMRADTAAGGTYRQWLETQSAIAKAQTEEEIRAIQTCCMLSLGLVGERSKVSRGLLENATQSTNGDDNTSGQRVVESLIGRKLLLHRVHNDEVSVWHGTDLDLRSRLSEVMDGGRAGFQLLEFLEAECVPPTWRPVRFNDENWMRRYFESEYQLARPLIDRKLAASLLDMPAGKDGKIVYLIPDSTKTVAEARKLAGEITQKKKAKRLIIALSTEVTDLSEVSLEIWGLTQMQHDTDLVESDPLLLDELRQMEEDARTRLALLLDRTVKPNSKLEWYWQGDCTRLASGQELREWLSGIASDIYPSTPRLRNEVINRRRPSPVVVNARKKLVGAILELSGTPNLGFGDEKFRLEVGASVESMYRALLKHTGLYRQNGDTTPWTYSAPKDIADPGLKKVWRHMQKFFTKAADRPKQLKELLDQLQSPPYGTRTGVIPILLASAFKAFPTAGALTCDGQYVEDIKPSDIELLCKEPARYALDVLALKEDQRQYLHGVFALFSQGSEYDIDEADLIRSCFEAIAGWRQRLPQAARTTHRISKDTTAVRKILLEQSNPVRLLLKELPLVFANRTDNLHKILGLVSESKKELDSVPRRYYDAAKDTVNHTVGGWSEKSTRAPVRQQAKQWAACFNEAILKRLQNPKAKPLVQRFRTTFSSDDAFIDSIAMVVHEKRINSWQDADLVEFEQKLRGIVSEVEEGALDTNTEDPLEAEAIEGLRVLVEHRIERLYDRLQNLVGTENAQDALSDLMTTKEVRHG